MKKLKEVLLDKLNDELQNRKITAYRFAKMANTSNQYMTPFLKGEKSYTADKVEDYLKLLNVQIEVNFKIVN